MKVIPTGETLGATVEGIDLAKPLGPADFRALLKAIGQHGVLRFPMQSLDAAQLKAFSARFGSLEINVAGAYQEPGHPEVMILSNIVENGRPIGARDAGQDWHTDMSYNATIATRELWRKLGDDGDCEGGVSRRVSSLPEPLGESDTP